MGANAAINRPMRMRASVRASIMMESRAKMLKYILLVVYLIFTLCGLILVKKGGGLPVSFENGITFSPPSLMFIVGVLCYGISFMLMLTLLPMFRLSFLTPATTGIVQVAILIASYFVFGEQIKAVNVLGCLLVVAGVFFLAR